MLGLLLLAPWVPEYLVGSHTVLDLPLIVFLVPMYGGGALLIREVARRSGRGWPTILLLGLAYGVVEAGLLDQSLFDPDFAGQDFQSVAPLPGLGISAFYLLVFVVGHAVWSIGTPIALIEALVPDRAEEPWLGVPGLLVTTGLYLAGSAMIYTELRTTEGYDASAPQLVVAAVAALGLVVAAFTVPLRRPTEGAGPAVPGPWLVLGIGFVAAGLFGLVENWWGVGLSLGVLVGTAWWVSRWSGSTGWTARHRLALAGAALLTWAWHGFVLHPWRDVPAPLERLSDTAFAVAAVVLLVVADRRLRPATDPPRAVPATARPGHAGS